jgi:hypothetical protein
MVTQFPRKWFPFFSADSAEKRPKALSFELGGAEPGRIRELTLPQQPVNTKRISTK